MSIVWRSLRSNGANPDAPALALERAGHNAFDEAALENEKDEHDRQRPQKGAGHDRAVLLTEGTDQRGQPEADRELLVASQHDKRPDVVVPRRREEENAHDG